MEGKNWHRELMGKTGSFMGYLTARILRLLPKRLQNYFLSKLQYLIVKDRMRQQNPFFSHLLEHYRRRQRRYLWAERVGKSLGLILVGLMLIVLLDRGVSMYRAWTNTTGIYVRGYGLFRKEKIEYFDKEQQKKDEAAVKPLIEDFRRSLGLDPRREREWEFVEFYKSQALCERYVGTKTIVRYKEAVVIEHKKCSQMTMSYPPGMGPNWGFLGW